MAEHAANDLEREMQEGLPQQRREWVIQRVAWLFLYALLAALVLGLVGKGPLSATVVAAPDESVLLEYERFVRHRARDTLKLALRAEGDTLELRLNSQYVRRVAIEEIVPPPSRVLAGEDEHVFVFATSRGGEVHVRIEYEPDETGRLTGWVGAGGGPRVSFEQFVYP